MSYLLYINLLLDLIYGDNLYDKPNNENFQNKIEKLQFRACLAIRNIKRKKL